MGLGMDETPKSRSQLLQRVPESQRKKLKSGEHQRKFWDCGRSGVAGGDRDICEGHPLVCTYLGCRKEGDSKFEQARHLELHSAQGALEDGQSL